MKNNTNKWVMITLAASLSSTALLAGCGTSQTQQPTAPKQEQTTAPKSGETTKATPADYAKAHKEIVEELEKGDNGGKPDYSKIEKLYNDSLKLLVTSRDSEYNEQLDQQISSAIQAAKDGKLKTDVVAELVDKLGQKVFFLSIRHDFKEVSEKWSDKKAATDEVVEGKAYYDSALKGMIGKRDSAYGTQLDAAITGAFSDMTAAIDKGDKLAFSLSQQVADKSLMNAFYLAVGGSKGYAYKIEAAVKEGKDPKASQAEGWAFYQSIYGYLVKQNKEDADFVQKQFDLSSDVKAIKGDAIHQALVRSIAKVALHEYEESQDNWGKDKAAITAMEGAMFAQMIQDDAKKVLGNAGSKKLFDNAKNYLDLVKKGDKDKAAALYKELKSELNKLAKVGK